MPASIGIARANVAQVRADAERAGERGLIAQIILRHGAADSPAAGDIGAVAARTHLLCVAFDAAEGAIDLRAALRSPGASGRVTTCAGLDEVLPAELERRGDNKSPEGKRGAQENTEKNQRARVHAFLLTVSRPVMKSIA